MNNTIGFVGLGLMGSGMALNLVNAGFRVIGYDLDSDKVATFTASGGHKSEDPETMPAQVDVIVLSLPNSDVVNEVVHKTLRLKETGTEKLILIDTTTADPGMSKALAEQLQGKGITMLDATISGTSKMCAEKNITLMVGGDQSIFQQCDAIFAALAAQTFYLGPNGSGAMMKLIVNLVLGMNRMVLAEGLSLGKRAGVDSEQMLNVLKNSAAYSKAIDMKGLKMASADFLPAEGKLAFHLKDVRLMLDLSRQLNFPLPLSCLHAQALTSLVAKGRGEWDNAAIMTFYDDLVSS
ncbi:MAG: NAD(P)-dependent oxidoreductase [Desulfobacterales bacterium]|nr:NAD(P)-dependent oxidoreductase [Desulfobacterales bacterium]MDX2512179.1 NAD(P)-dependent oxidoreductase [Desulfobacterales bacterium]